MPEPVRPMTVQLSTFVAVPAAAHAHYWKNDNNKNSIAKIDGKHSKSLHIPVQWPKHALASRM